MDYGTNKKAYVDAFFENINWEMVERFFNYASK
jgi:superoxide dismutase